jgi:hypothetical protein
MHIPIGDLFTSAEIKKAGRLWDIYRGSGDLNRVLTEQIVEPAIDRINTKTGQLNSPAYLAYALEYLFREFHSLAQPDGPEIVPVVRELP